MNDQANRPATMEDLAGSLSAIAGVTGGVATYQTLSVIGALAEARALDPAAVAKWAEFFAEGLSPAMGPDTRNAIRDQLKTFAATIRSLSTLPPDAGRA